MKAELYFINALSNTHVGSGEVNFGLVDNLIQRDPVTAFPTINASSLKGALREHFENDEEVDVTYIFGSDPKEKQNRSQGHVRFFDADLLALPVRCTGGSFPYVHLVSQDQIGRIVGRLKSFNMDNPFNSLSSKEIKGSVRIEDLNNKKNYSLLKEAERDWIGERMVYALDKDLQQLSDDNHLPVITRNCLDDGGQSENLFYEQVLPRYTRMLTIMLFDEQDKKFEKFAKKLDKAVVQIGAHATLGYGYCKFTRFVNPNNTPKK